MATFKTGLFKMTAALVLFWGLCSIPFANGYQTNDNSNGAYNSSVGNTMMMAGQLGASSGTSSCNNSNTLDPKMKADCDSSRSIMQYSTVANIVGQQAGSVLQQTTGATQLQDASNSDALVAEAEANAAMAKTAAYSQVTVGAMNTGLGIYQIMQAGKHEANADKIKAAQDDFKSAGGVKAITGGDTSKSYASDARMSGFVEVKDNAQNSNASQYAQKVMTKMDVNSTDDSVRLTAYDSTQLSDLQKKAQSGALSPQDANTLKQLQTKQKDRDEDITRKSKSVDTAVRSYEGNAASEQTGMASQVKGSGILSTITGSAQLMEGGLSYMAAIQAESAAKALATADATPTPLFSPDLGQVAPPISTSGGVAAIMPGTQVNPLPAPNAVGPSGAIGDLGQPFNTNLNQTPSGPTAGMFTAGAGTPPPANPAIAGAVGGAGQTQAAKEDATDNAARPADNRVPALYGGGGYAGGGVGAAVGADKGMDLSGLLGQFLPKTEDKNPKKDIMEFGSRGPASAEPYSYLGRDVNLFERVSERAQEEVRMGTVGI